MKAITLHQPYASLIAIGEKPYETRSWAPPSRLLGQRIAIHAGAKPIPRDMEDDTADEITEAFGRCGWPHWLPRGAVVCTAVLRAAFRLGPLAEGTGVPAASILERRLAPGLRLPPCFTVRLDPFGDYHEERWAWLLQDIQPLEPPVPAKGAQGFWDWPSPSDDRHERVPAAVAGGVR